MRRPYQVAAVVLLGLAVFVGHGAMKLRYYTSLGPGAGFFPFWLAVALGLLAIVMFCQATMRRPEAMPADFYPTAAGAVRISGTLATMLVAALVVETVGFRLTMLAFILVMLNLFGRRGLVETALIAVGGSFGVHYVFVELLKVPLPAGLF